MTAKRKIIDLRHRLAWGAASIVSFLLYYTGIVSLYRFWRLTVRRRPAAFILMYHRVHDAPRDRDISVSTLNFRRQLRYLKDKCAVLTLEELVRTGPAGAEPGRDAVAVTFDDGYRDNITNALPLLAAHRIPATVFVVTDWIGGEGMLTEEDITSCSGGPLSFGAHTESHPVLSETGDEEADREIRGSKGRLEEITGGRIGFFAYPKGKSRDFADRDRELARKAGFDAAFSTENTRFDSHSDRYAIGRLGIRDVPLFVFKARVSGIFESLPFMAARKLGGLT